MKMREIDNHPSDLPREVRNEQQGVEHPADNVTEQLAVAEATVTALMSKHPPSSEREREGQRQRGRERGDMQ